MKNLFNKILSTLVIVAITMSMVYIPIVADENICLLNKEVGATIYDGNDYIEFALPTVQTAGVYAVSANLRSNDGTGHLKIAIKNKPYVAFLEFKENTSNEFAKVESCQYLYLDAGENTLLIKNHGRGDGYRSYVAWESFTFSFMPLKTVDDLTINVEAEQNNSGVIYGIRDVKNAKVITQRSGDTLGYKVDVFVGGQYKVYANAQKINVSEEPIASGIITHNGKNTSFSYDYTGKLSTNFADIEIATLNLSEGENIFSITPTSSRFYPDYYTLVKVGEYIPKTYYKVNNTGEVHLAYNAASPVEMKVNIEKEGVYAVSLSLDDRETGGRIKVVSDSHFIGYEFSDNTSGYNLYSDVGYLYLEKGENKIYIQNDGKGESATFHNYIKCDYIELNYAEGKTKTDCILLSEAENAEECGEADVQVLGNTKIIFIENGKSAIIPVEVSQDGEYVLYANARNNHQKGTPIAKGTAMVNGETKQFEADYTGLNTTIFKDFEIGIFNLSQGTNYIYLTVDASVLSIDYLMIKTFVYETHYELVNNDSKFLAYNAASPVEMTVDIEKEGVYAVSLSLDDRETGGRIKVVCGLQVIAYDFSDSTSGYNKYSDAGYFYLEKGENKIYIQNDGKGENEVFHNFIKFDYMELDYEPSKSISDCILIQEAENGKEVQGENEVITPEIIGAISTVKIDATKVLTIPVNVPKDGRYKLIANVRNNHMSTPIFDGGVSCRDNMVPFEADFTGVNSTIYKDVDLGILEMDKGENEVVLKINSSLITIDYIMFFEYTYYDPVVEAINSSVTTSAVKNVMEANKDVFASYDEIISELFYPEALYERFLSRNFADLDSLKEEWGSLTSKTPLVDLQIKTKDDSDFVGGKKKFESGQTRVVINPYKIKEGNLVIAAVYENNKLLGTNNAIVDENPITLYLGDFTIDDTKEYSFKLMCWDSLDKMNSYIKDLNETYVLYVDSKNGNDNSEGTENAPLLSLQEAVSKAQAYAKKYDNDIEIRLNGGEHFLTEPINITNEGFSQNKLTITGDKNSETIVNGGIYAGEEKWSKEGNLYVAVIEDAEDVRELYINGNEAERARTKNAVKITGDVDAKIDENGNLLESKGFKVTKTGLSPSELDAVLSADDLEAIMDISWVRQRVKVDSCSESTEENDFIEINAHESFAVQFSEGTKADWILPIYATEGRTYKGTSGNGTNYWAEEKKVYFENSFGLLDSEGEFYFDKNTKKLYYYPKDGEVIKEAIIPVSEGFINIEGTPEHKLKDITISDIDFKYGTWLLPGRECIITSQAGRRYGSKRMLSQINVSWAENVKIENVEMENISSGAIDFYHGVTNSYITDCRFNNIGASAISVGPFIKKTAAETMCKNITIYNNIIDKIGYVHGGHPAITLYYVNNTKVLHNEINNTTYSGINLGWGWGQNVDQCAQNEIAYNKITNVMNVYQDGGFIYTLGDCHSSLIHDNYMSGMANWGGGLYFDSGSANITAKNNVLLDCTNPMPNKVLSGWMLTTILENTNIVIDTVYTDDAKDRTNENISISNVKTSDYDKEVARIFADAGIESK